MTENVPDMPKVVIIAYEGAQKSAVFGLSELFDVANRLVDEDGGARIEHRIREVSSLMDEGPVDAIILPPNLVSECGNDDKALHMWIAAQHRAGAIACSACAGTYWLAHAGILEGRPATTHWAFESDFRAAFPKVQLHPEHILVDDNDIVTAGGVMAWVDLGIHLTGRWLGNAVVSRTCRQMLIDPTGRDQRNYRSFRPNMAHQDPAIRGLQLWMEGNTEADLSVQALAQRVGMSKRSLQRRIEKCTGLSLSHYVQELRIEKAKGLLELTALSISDICWKVGYQDISAFTRVFKSISGLTPGAYRKRFRINRA